MKPIIIILWGMFLFVFFLTGCAGSPARTADNPYPDEQKDVEITPTPFGDIKRYTTKTGKDAKGTAGEKRVLEEQEGFEIISTPFGYIKQKRKATDRETSPSASEEQVIKPAPPPDASSSPGPIKQKKKLTDRETSPPAPEEQARMSAPASQAEPGIGMDGPSEEAMAESGPGEISPISFDFDDADLSEVIRVMADFLQISYLVDPGVSGKVTIHTAGEIEVADVFPIFYQILEVNGLTAVKEGSVYRIINRKDASRMPIPARRMGDAEDMAPEEKIVLQIIPLKFISVQEVSKLITPFISSEGTIVMEGNSNTLLVVDRGINIVKILKLVKVFDVSVFEKIDYRFYTFQNALAEDMAKTIKEALAPSADGGKLEAKFISIKWLNALLVVSSRPDIFGRVKSLIGQLDIPSEDAQPQIYVYSVKNGMAADLADTLRSVFGASGESQKTARRDAVPTNPYAIGASDKDTPPSSETSPPKPVGKPSATASGASAALLRGEIKITDDEIRNALIIEATPADYKNVEKILERLDVLPRQVLIDVVIAEISLGQGTELGIEWTFKKEDWSDTGSLSALIGGSGLQYARGLSEKWQAALHALANDNKLNIISSPTILASDNKQAKIDVTTEVPIPSTNYTYVTDGDNVLETSVQYRNTGVILEVTPHINEYGLVTMDISQEVSNVGELIKVAGQDYYSFDTKNIVTSLTVNHNQSIVIGGLISSEKKNASSGVPWLTKIPVIRWLTGTEKKEESRSELIVMITPHVITSLEDVDSVSEEFKNKIEGLKAALK